MGLINVLSFRFLLNPISGHTVLNISLTHEKNKVTQKFFFRSKTELFWYLTNNNSLEKTIEMW